MCQKCHREEIKTTKPLLEFLPRKLSPTSLITQILFLKNPLPTWKQKWMESYFPPLLKAYFPCRLTRPIHGFFLQHTRNLQVGLSKVLAKRQHLKQCLYSSDTGPKRTARSFPTADWIMGYSQGGKKSKWKYNYSYCRGTCENQTAGFS